MGSWWKELDRILRGDATRLLGPEWGEDRDPGRRAVGGPGLAGDVLRGVHGLFLALQVGRSFLLAAGGVHGESTGVVRSDAGDHAAVALRVQRPGGLEADAGFDAPAARGGDGGDAVRAFLDGADRRVLFAQHDVLSVHDPGERRRVRGLRIAWADLPAPDLAEAERGHAPAARGAGPGPGRSRRGEARRGKSRSWRARPAGGSGARAAREADLPMLGRALRGRRVRRWDGCSGPSSATRTARSSGSGGATRTSSRG